MLVTVDFKPIAVCLMSSPQGGLEIGVHQVIPENARSIAEFVQRNRGTLLFHVVVFTQMSYAECQSHIRRIVAARSGSRLSRGPAGKAIQGDRAAIERAMTQLALDASEIAGSGGADSSSDEDDDADREDEERAVEDDDEDTGDSEDAGFIDDECEEEDDLEDSDVDVEVTPVSSPRASTLKRLRRGAT
jgi:hypothetical protein